jgi:hypothetical protein
MLPAALLLGSSLAGCTMNRARGVVAMKIDEKTAHVCVRKVEVVVGDRMTLYRNECSRSRSVKCNMVLVSEGTITELLNEHYALLTFDKPTDFREGDLIEKESR